MRVPLSWLKEYVDIPVDAKALAHALTMAGMEIEQIEEAGDDVVIEFDLKANRSDLFSVTGIAREVSALFGTPLHLPEIKVTETEEPVTSLTSADIKNPELCSRFTSRVITDLKIGPSPDWMARRLTLAGMRPINNVVDITNYVMLEWGHPLHAFDYDKVNNHHIDIRLAKPGETVTTLDDIQRDLQDDMLILADPEVPLDVAGVMGGADSEISNNSTGVILEALNANAVSIRRTSLKLGLRTFASSRFEKNQDPELTSVVTTRAAQMMVEYAGGRVAKGEVDIYPKPRERRELTFDTSSINWLIGMEIPDEVVTQKLTALGFSCTKANGHQIKVNIPTWRVDINEAADLVEEVARLAGYDQIPSTLPEGDLPQPAHDHWFEREEAIRDSMLGSGLNEIITYSLTSRETISKSLSSSNVEAAAALISIPAGPDRKSAANTNSTYSGSQNKVEIPAIMLSNPLSSEMECMRLSLIPSMLDTLRENLKRSGTDIRFFEIGRRYLPSNHHTDSGNLPDERHTLAIGISGAASQSWIEEDRQTDFYDLKGILENLLESLKIETYRFKAASHPSMHPGRSAALELPIPEHASLPASARLLATEEQSDQGTLQHQRTVPAGTHMRVAAVFGEIHPEVQKNFGLPQRTYIAEIDLEYLFAAVPDEIHFRKIPRYPSVSRDLAIVVDQKIPADDIATSIRSTGWPIISNLKLFDVYQGDQMETGKKSLAFSVSYQDMNRTLTDEEADALQQRILGELERRFGATLRSR